MRNRMLPLAVLALLSGFGEGRTQDDFQWMTNLDGARKKAAREDKPLFVVFR